MIILKKFYKLHFHTKKYTYFYRLEQQLRSLFCHCAELRMALHHSIGMMLKCGLMYIKLPLWVGLAVWRVLKALILYIDTQKLWHARMKRRNLILTLISLPLLNNMVGCSTRTYDQKRIAPKYNPLNLKVKPIKINENTSDPAKRYASLSNSDLASMRDFATAMSRYVDTAFSLYSSVLWLYGSYFSRYGNYRSESAWLAQKCGISQSKMATLQRSYTISHFTSGCTTICKWDDIAGEMLCMRSLDWSQAESVASATRIFQHEDSQGVSYYSAGPLGMIGELTAVSPGRFSVVVNWAPNTECILTGYQGQDPTFALREVLSSRQSSYDEFVKELCRIKTAAPIFFTVCGTEKGQACVIELSQHGYNKFEIGSEMFLVKTNHHFGDAPTHSPGCDEYIGEAKSSDACYWADLEKSSFRRYELAMSSLTDGIDLEDIFGISPIWNYESAYWAKLRPGRSDESCIEVSIRG